MIKNFTLKFTENSDLNIHCGEVIIIVGPNNSGKSLVLRELEQHFTIAGGPSDKKIIKDYEIECPNQTEIENLIEKSKHYVPPNLSIDLVTIGRVNPTGGIETANLHRQSLFVMANSGNKDFVAHNLLRWGLIRLDGRSRFNLTNDQQAGDLLGAPTNVLSHLFQDDATRIRVRNIVKDAFGVYYVIDPTNLGQLRIRLSRDAPQSDEQSLNNEARKFHKAAIHIKDASDGVQAFTGIVTAVFSGEFHTILIDEPEAFLHPPLARKLGKNLAAIAKERKGTLIASTHSADFLMGCVQATNQVQIVRLEYSEGKSSGRKIDPAQLNDFLKNPLIRSANVVSGLFYDGVVVLESDNDRAFYGEIYHRMAEIDSNLPSILFVNAQNKQTIHKIVAPLRAFGVPAAAIPDIDILKDGGGTWTAWLTCAQIPNAMHGGLGIQRSAIYNCFNGPEKDMKKNGGINALDTDDRRAAIELFDTLDNYGVFTVRGGEMESWLSCLNVPGKKTDWTVAMLDRLGRDPESPDYVHPSGEDVWEFMQKVVSWVRNPARKGMH